jgi:hypothetical protein
LSGAAAFSTTVVGLVSIAAGDSIDVQVVASAGAATANLRVSLVINQ